MVRSHMYKSKTTYSFDHTVTWVHVANEVYFIFIFMMPIATKLDRLVKLKSRRRFN